MLPFHKLFKPPRLTISLNAWEVLCTRGLSPINLRLPSIWICTLTRSAGDAKNCARPPAVTPAAADFQRVKLSESWTNFLRKMSKVAMRTPLKDKIISQKNLQLRCCSPVNKMTVQSWSKPLPKFHCTFFSNNSNCRLHHPSMTLEER